MNQTVNQSVRWENMTPIRNEIDGADLVVKENRIFPRLNNNGSSPEDMYYNWTRGYIVCEFFTPALSQIFGDQEAAMKTVGHDSLSEIKTFRILLVLEAFVLLLRQKATEERHSRFLNASCHLSRKTCNHQENFASEPPL